MSENNYIPFHRPCLGEEESEAVQKVLASGWLTTGPVAHEFEKQFAAYVGSEYAIAVNSCTAALQLALDAIGLQRDDEVLVPSYTFTASAEIVTYFGARPVLCDSVAGGFNIDPVDAERHITNKTRAIIPVHIAGEVCRLDAIHHLARRHGLRVIEDAAHALPVSYKGGRVGSISELTAFSFYTTKTITTGEGGMLTTNDKRCAERATMMRLHGIGRDAWKRYARSGSWFYEVHEAGYKMNLPDILAAIGLAQLNKCDRFLAARQETAAYYQEKLGGIEELLLPPSGSNLAEHSWHLFILRLRSDLLNISREEFIEELKALGIGTSVHFIPLHRHPYYVRQYGCRNTDFPNADDSYSRCLSLPIFPGLTDSERRRIVDAVVHLVEKHRKAKIEPVYSTGLTPE
jgi:dTDP-4-amino-4,6-dideoxygalactose transaminase